MVLVGLLFSTVAVVLAKKTPAANLSTTTTNPSVECKDMDYAEVYNEKNTCWFDLKGANCNDCSRCLYPIVDVVDGKDSLKCVNKRTWDDRCTNSRFTFELNGRLACAKCHPSCDQCYGREANECLNCHLGDISDDQWVDYWPDGSCKKLQQVEKPEPILEQTPFRRFFPSTLH